MSNRIEEAKKRVAELQNKNETYTSSRIEEARKRVESLTTPKTSTTKNTLTEDAKKYLDSKMNLVNMPQKPETLKVKSPEEIKLETEKKNIQGKAWDNALKELGYTQEEIRGNADKISEVYKQQNVELAKLDYDPKKYDYNIIKANVAGQNAMTDIISNKTSKMTFEEYEEYINSEYKKLDKYEKYKSQAYKNSNWEAVGQYEILIQNAKFAEELDEMKNKYDDSTFFANYNIGQMQIEYNTAMNRYFTTDNEQDFLKAEQIRKKIEYYNQRAEKAGQGNWITKDFAEYAPQMVEQFRTGLAGALGGAVVGGGVGSVIPGAGTAAGAVKGAGVGYVGGVATFSYNQMRGAAYAELLELGVPADIAKAVAKDTALWQSIIEGAGAGVDLLTLGVGKLFSKGAKTAAQLTAKKMIVNALKAYGWNLVTETAEEATQEIVAIKQEEKALEMAGIKDTRTDAEKRSRIIEAGFGGFKIALISGAGNAIGNITVSTINNATLKQTDAFYDDYIEEVKNSDLNETDKNALIKDAEEGREIAKSAIQEAIKTNKPITNTQVAEKTQQMKQEIDQVTSVLEKISRKEPEADTSVVKQKVADLISNNDDVYDEDIADIVNNILEEEFKDADLDDDNVYDAYDQRTQQLYKEVEQTITSQGYEMNKAYANGEPSYVPIQKTTATVSEPTVKYNTDGSFDKVRINDDIFENNEGKSISQTIKDYLVQHIGEYADIIESGQRVYLGEDLPNEYVFSKSAKRLSAANKRAKGRATTGLKEIINNANNRRYEKNKKKKHIVDAKYGFYRYDTKFSFDYKGKENTYTATVLIRNDANGKKYLYDILGIKKESNLPPIASNSKKSSAMKDGPNHSLNKSITRESKNVNLNDDTLKETDVSYSINDGFYSQLEKVVSEKMPNKANPSEIMNLLKKNGVKQDELDWLDLENWLSNKLEKVSKEEVIEYVKANQMQIEEIRRDDGTKTFYSEKEEEVRTQMDDLKNEALEIMDKYHIYTWRRTEPFDRIEDFVKVHGEKNIYELADLAAFAQKSETEYYIDEETGEFFTLEEMHKDVDKLLDMLYEFQELEEEYEQIPETEYGYSEDFEDSTKYSNYKTKWDGENYREILFTIPDDRGIRPYSSPHWSEINVLAHTRLQDYKDDKNSNVLFIEEIQSDLHQEGRKYGYYSQALQNKYNELVLKARTAVNDFAEGAITKEEYERIEEEYAEFKQQYPNIDSNGTYMPSAKFPFKKTWHEFVLRKIINEAVQEGYDKVAWTTGKQQNDRYNLARYIDSINYKKDGNTYSITTFDKKGNEHYFGRKNEQELEELVGKEITQKIVSGEYNTEKLMGDESISGTIKNADLEIGGEGMKGFYEKIIPDYLNKYLKKWGSKVEEVIIPDGKEQHVQQGFTITPEMRESVMSQGQTLFEPEADYAPTITGGNKIAKKFKVSKYIDINGTKVTNAQDVADVAQIFRNPNYETFRMVYVKGDVIVGQEGITSKMPGRTKVSVERTNTINFYKTKERMRRLGADGYYMVHNHPTGRAVASKEDVDVTRAYKNNIEGFKGHIIVDHNTYAYIGNNLTPKNSIEFTPTVESYNLADYLPWTDMRITSREALSKLMSEVKNNEDFSSLILTDGAGNVRNIIDIPNSFWNMSEKQIEGYIRNVSRENGSTRAFVGTTDFDVFRKIGVLQGSNITDTLLYKLKEDETVVLNATQGIDVFAGVKDKAVRVAEEPSKYEIEERKKEVAKFIEDRKAVSGTKGLTFNSNEVIDKIFEKLGVSAKGNTKQMQKSVKELNEALQSGGLTDEKIEKVVRELGKKLTESIDEYYKANKQLKDDIRTTKIYVPETVKNDIADWGDYRRSILGTVRTTNDETALPIDTFYMELQEVYGQDMFPENIKNISDQLQRIVEVGKSIKKIDTNLEDYYNKTFGKESWEETANDLINELKLMRNAKLKEVAEPTARGGIKTRSYTKTAKKESLTEEFIDLEKLTYSIKTNLSSVGQANAIINNQGYDKALETFQNKITEGKRIDAVDITLGERLIQETIKRGQFEKARQLIYDVTILATELGQSVQALSIISRLSPEGQLMYLQRYADRYNAKHTLKKSKRKALNELSQMETPIVTGEQEGLVQAGDMFGKIQIPKELSDELLAAKNSEEIEIAVDKIKQALADQMEVTLEEKIDEWRYLAMLGNPKTHIRNIASNVVMRGTYETKNVIQRTIETMADPLLEQRTRTFKKASEAVKKFAEQSAKDNIDNIISSGKYTAEQQIKSMRKIFGNETMERLRKFNSKALEVEDLWFSKPVYESNLTEYLTANNIRTQKDIDLNPQLVQDAINHAISEAQKVTFRQYSKLASQLSQIEGNNLFNKLLVGGIVPFKKTPINIVKTAASYSPLGLVETLTNESIKLKKGLIDANTYIDRVAQGLTGTMLFGLGILGAATGFIIASTGEDDEYKEKIGKTASYSFKFGDTYYSMSWLSPAAIPMFMGAEMYQATQGTSNLNINDIVDVMAKTIDPLSEMSMVSSLNDALRSFSSYDNNTEAISNILLNGVESYIGQYFPTAGSQINKIIDKTIRTTRASKNSPFKFGEKIVRQNTNKLPGGSFLLEPSTDIWGNEAKRSENIVLRTLDSLISPGTTTVNKATEVDEKILELYEQTGNKDILPKIPTDYFSEGGVRYEMNAKEYTFFKKTYGQTAYMLLEELFDSKEYDKYTDAEKEKAIKDVYEKSKYVAREPIKEMAEISEEIKSIKNDLTLNRTERKEAVDELETEKNNILKNWSTEESVELYDFLPPQSTYKYQISKGQKVDVTFTKDDENAYAKLAKEYYEKEIKELKKQKKYKDATTSEKKEQEKDILTKARNYAKEEISKKVYERNR